MTNKSFALYISSLAPEQRAIVEALRASVLAAAPGAMESIKWSQPVFEFEGPFCWIKAHKAHVTLGFWRGMQLSSGKGVVEGSGTKMGHIKFRTYSDLKPVLVKKLTKEAVNLNREQGDPTKKK